MKDFLESGTSSSKIRNVLVIQDGWSLYLSFFFLAPPGLNCGTGDLFLVSASRVFVGSPGVSDSKEFAFSVGDLSSIP